MKKFSLEALVDGAWLPLTDELAEDGDGLTTIGHRRIICFPTVKASKLRFTIEDTKAEPVIKKIGLYLAPALTADIPDSGEKRSSGLHIFFSSPTQMLMDWDTEQTVTGFRYLPPQDGTSGTITHYTLWGATNWRDWKKLTTPSGRTSLSRPRRSACSSSTRTGWPTANAWGMMISKW